VATLAQQTVREARRVIAGLRPTALDDFGLSTAIQHEMAALRREGWDITYHEDLDGRRLPPPIETTLFRVAQESLTNIRKHAGTTRVRVILTVGEQTARLEVRDWGSGFNRSLPAPTAGGEQVGIAGMRERVKLLNGQFYLHSRPGRGTVVIAIVPLSLHDTLSTAAHDTVGQVSRRNG
jgi:signal transduction histidine kinase